MCRTLWYVSTIHSHVSVLCYKHSKRLFLFLFLPYFVSFGCFLFYFCTVIEYRTMKKRENTENNGTWLFKMWCWAVWDASGIKVVITGEDLNGSCTVQMFWNQFLQESLFLFSVFFWNLLMLLITVWTFNTALFSVNWRFVFFGQNHWFVQKKKEV